MVRLSSHTDRIEKPKKRLMTTMFIILGIFLILFTRLWFLQIVKGEEYRILSDGNRIRLKRLKSPRGLILDRYHNVLVQNRPCFTASIVLEDVQSLESVLERLSKLVDRPVPQMKAKIKKANSLPFEPITIISDLSFDEIARLEEHSHELPGVSVEVESIRYYPYNEMAAHLFGYMGEINPEQFKKAEYKTVHIGDQIGQSGLENILNAYLMGIDGGKHVEVDAEGRELRTIGYLPPEPGKNIILTIDYTLQEQVEEVLGKRCGSVIVMDPRDGRILAMASHPTFNPNLFARGISHNEWTELVNNPKEPLQNRSIMASYPPGSIFKLVVASAGLSTGIIDKKSTFNCTGNVTLGKWIYYCWKEEGHGNISLIPAIIHSCNVYFYQLASRLGIDSIAGFARYFGLGSQTGILLQGESSGLIPDSAWKKRVIGKIWYPGETITASIGQGYILVTPIQLACLMSAIVNGGYLYEPMIISAVETSEMKVVKSYTPVLKNRLPIKQSVYEILRSALNGVVNQGGTGWRAYSPEVVIAGKTGTAQVVRVRDREDDNTGAEENIPEHLRDHAWFVAFAPYEDPEIVVVVLIEHGGHGGYTSAPLAKEVIEAYFRRDEIKND